MDIHRTEEEQVEALKAWWAENGRSAVFGIALGLGAIFGYRAWQAHEVAQAEAASLRYEELLIAMQQPGSNEIRGRAEALLREHPDGAYAVFANMVLAREAVDAGDLDRAEALLASARRANRDDVLDLELRLRLAQVQSARGRHDEALALLDVEAGAHYAAAFEELRGDIEARRGNSVQARAAYERALAAARAAGADAGVLELKLDNLGPGGES